MHDEGKAKMTPGGIYAGIEEEEDELETPYLSDEDFEEDSARFVYDIGLQLAGDEASGYHTKNDPREGREWHREDVTQRKGVIGIRCHMIDVIHGKWGPDSKDSATLVVFLFRFDVKKRSRHIARAEITVNFFGADETDPFSRPAVQAISFDESSSFCVSKQTESTTKSIEGSAGLTAAQLAEIAGTLKWEKSVSRDTYSYTTIVGNRYRREHEFGPDDQANWVLLENSTLETGVPVALRAAVLLKREDDSPFTCEVDFKIKADLRTTLHDLFGSKVIDDPVLFNPKVKVDREKTLEILKHFDRAAIGNFDVNAVGDVTFLRLHDGAIKH